ncbi:iron-sulfur cluster biosynthesis family protein [Desmospora profundinema]|uniref:Fe-S cluster assembly iron-binding protein IscA n=1 Tax=Desmospora profundinema TaxID=1571184 RepID=A0ABU1IJA1_9BACL|nr:iron-sulfur cluster biosynthesis family protein [Desmospora profundinema]MDR6224855.1 Fe-S cluster assembly iron-binding protein IscA [Desmospora profundinema]
MEVIVNPEARRILMKHQPEPDAALRLAAMDEGCGCGATVLYEMNWDLPRPDDIRLKAGDLTVVVDRHSLAYFDSTVFVECRPGTHAFWLKSPNQIYLSNLVF